MYCHLRSVCVRGLWVLLLRAFALTSSFQIGYPAGQRGWGKCEGSVPFCLPAQDPLASTAVPAVLTGTALSRGHDLVEGTERGAGVPPWALEGSECGQSTCHSPRFAPTLSRARTSCWVPESPVKAVWGLTVTSHRCEQFPSWFCFLCICMVSFPPPPRRVPRLISYSLIFARLLQHSFIMLTPAIHFPNVSCFYGDVFPCSDKLILCHQ